MRHVVVADGSFPYPTIQEYHPDALLAKSIGMYLSDDYPVELVRVRLSGRWATYAATHRWHRSQDVTPPDARGHVVVNWTVRTCPELRALLLSFGAGAEVLSPVTLRNAVAKELRAATSAYARPSRPGLAVAQRSAGRGRPGLAAARVVQWAPQGRVEPKERVARREELTRRRAEDCAGPCLQAAEEKFVSLAVPSPVRLVITGCV